MLANILSVLLFCLVPHHRNKDFLRQDAKGKPWETQFCVLGYRTAHTEGLHALLLMDYPICLRFTHESTLLMPLQFPLLVVCTYPVTFSRHRNWTSKRGKKGSATTPTSFQHNPPTFFCLLSCSDSFKHAPV